MRQLSHSIGYGTTATTDIDDFSRIRLGHFRDNEEVRYDRPGSYSGTCYEYVGVAEQGSGTNLPVWNCVRLTWNNGHRVREQFKQNVAWDDRAQGWL